jgi:predicted DNA-binding protein YlxM (UPF0122 family)
MVASHVLDPKPTYHSAATIAKAKSLYIVKGWSASQIAAKFDIPSGSVSNWVFKGGWVAERERRLAKFEESQIASATDEHASFLASVSSEVEELTHDSLEVSRQAIAGGLKTTRELQQASQSAKNFLDMYMRANKLDRASAEVNIKADLVFRLPTEEPRNVTPLETAPIPQALPEPQA